MPDSAAKRAWDRENTRRVQLKLNNHTDEDIIEKLESVESIQGYIKGLIKSDIMKEGKTMKKEISLDNGRSYMNAAECIEELQKRSEEYEVPFAKLWQDIADRMDDEIREAVHAELAPCTEEEFLERYLELSPDDFIIG